jgi:hypothetical protein
LGTPGAELTYNERDSIDVFFFVIAPGKDIAISKREKDAASPTAINI